MTTEQKFARASVVLQRLRPFYAAVFRVIEKRPDPIAGGMAVTESALLYNPEKLETMPFDEFMYLSLHCVCHIALQHVPRRQGRDPGLWNAAADLFVARLLCDEFWIPKPGEIARYAGSGNTIRMPQDTLFDPSVDLEKDFVESIYLKLESQAAQNGYHRPGCDSAAFCHCGSGGGKPGTGSGPSAPAGFLLSLSRPSDLVDSGQDPLEMSMNAGRVLSEAFMRVEMAGTGAGNAHCRLRVMAEETRRSDAHWTPLVQKHLRRRAGADSSFKRPDKRMLWQKAIYPSQCADEDNWLKDLKICVDTSGSVSDQQIEEIYGQIQTLAKQYQLDAELIYWDVEIQSRGDFKQWEDLHKTKPYGRGGTNPACLFQYFDSAACKTKPLLTLVFTDGCFPQSWCRGRWQKKYRDTLWILSRDDYRHFAPPFGKKAAWGFKG